MIKMAALILLRGTIVLLVFVLLLAIYGQQAWPVGITLDDAYRDGIIAGCVRTTVTIMGEPPSDAALYQMITMCQSIADEIDAIESGDSTPLPTPQVGETI